MKNLVLVTMMAASLSACVSNKKDKANTAAAQSAGYASGQSDAQSNAVKAANFMINLESTASPTTTLTMIKFAKDNPNYAVLSVANGTSTIYYAIDISQYTTGTDANTYAFSHGIYAYLTNNGNGTFSCNAGTCYNASGATSSTMVFETTSTPSKDMDKAAAFAEAYQVEQAAHSIAANFGLSDDRAIEVAKLASAWNKLSQSRALTDADADAFANQLAGVSMSEINSAEKALAGGSMAEMNAVIAKAAVVNGTTSENMSAIMDKIFN